MNDNVLKFVPKAKIQTQVDAPEPKGAADDEIIIQTYLAPAYRDFLLAKGLTPHVMVKKPHDGKWSMPEEYVKDGHITLNISPQASINQRVLPEGIYELTARFNGVSRKLWFLTRDIQWVYAIESPNHMRMNFVAIPELNL